MHVEAHTVTFPHQYDMSDGDAPKQQSICVTVEHHVARVPAA